MTIVRFYVGLLSVFVSGLLVGIFVKGGSSHEQMSAEIRSAYESLQLDAPITASRPLSTSMQFVERLGLDRSAIGSKYFYYPRDIDAAIPYCFSDSELIRARMLELCPETFQSSTMQACKGIKGWTCSLTGLKSSPVQAKSSQPKADKSTTSPCSHEFIPVCCRIGATVHAVPNYCTCKQKGGLFIAPGTACN